jgi:hypothetical protein
MPGHEELLQIAESTHTMSAKYNISIQMHVFIEPPPASIVHVYHLRVEARDMNDCKSIECDFSFPSQNSKSRRATKAALLTESAFKFKLHLSFLLSSLIWSRN